MLQRPVEFTLCAEGKVISPVERRRLARLGTTSEIPRLPGRHGRDAGDAGRLAGVGGWIHNFGRGNGEHQIHPLLLDQLAGQLRRAAGIGLRVPGDDLEGLKILTDPQPSLRGLTNKVDHKGIGAPEGGQRAALRTQEPDPNCSIRGGRRTGHGVAARATAGATALANAIPAACTMRRRVVSCECAAGSSAGLRTFRAVQGWR